MPTQEELQLLITDETSGVIDAVEAWTLTIAPDPVPEPEPEG